jgi:hypothetical protein
MKMIDEKEFDLSLKMNHPNRIFLSKKKKDSEIYSVF